LVSEEHDQVNHWTSEARGGWRSKSHFQTERTDRWYIRPAP
jgi:hypothetical protein